MPAAVNIKSDLHFTLVLIWFVALKVWLGWMVNPVFLLIWCLCSATGVKENYNHRVAQESHNAHNPNMFVFHWIKLTITSLSEAAAAAHNNSFSSFPVCFTLTDWCIVWCEETEGVSNSVTVHFFVSAVVVRGHRKSHFKTMTWMKLLFCYFFITDVRLSDLLSVQSQKKISQLSEHKEGLWKKKAWRDCLRSQKHTHSLIHICSGSSQQCFNKRSGISRVSVGCFWLAVTEPWI